MSHWGSVNWGVLLERTQNELGTWPLNYILWPAADLSGNYGTVEKQSVTLGCSSAETHMLKQLLSLLSTQKCEPLAWNTFSQTSQFSIYKTDTELPRIKFYPTVSYLEGKKWNDARTTILSLFIRETVCRRVLRDDCMAHPVDRDVMLEKTKYETFKPRMCLHYFKSACKLFQASRECSLPKVLNYAQKLQFSSSKTLVLMLDLFFPPD